MNKLLKFQFLWMLMFIGVLGARAQSSTLTELWNTKAVPLTISGDYKIQMMYAPSAYEFYCWDGVKGIYFYSDNGNSAFKKNAKTLIQGTLNPTWFSYVGVWMLETSGVSNLSTEASDEFLSPLKVTDVSAYNNKSSWGSYITVHGTLTNATTFTDSNGNAMTVSDLTNTGVALDDYVNKEGDYSFLVVKLGQSGTQLVPLTTDFYAEPADYDAVATFEPSTYSNGDPGKNTCPKWENGIVSFEGYGKFNDPDKKNDATYYRIARNGNQKFSVANGKILKIEFIAKEPWYTGGDVEPTPTDVAGCLNIDNSSLAGGTFEGNAWSGEATEVTFWFTNYFDVTAIKVYYVENDALKSLAEVKASNNGDNYMKIADPYKVQVLFNAVNYGYGTTYLWDGETGISFPYNENFTLTAGQIITEGLMNFNKTNNNYTLTKANGLVSANGDWLAPVEKKLADINYAADKAMLVKVQGTVNSEAYITYLVDGDKQIMVFNDDVNISKYNGKTGYVTALLAEDEGEYYLYPLDNNFFEEKKVSAPTFSPAAGEVKAGTQVTLSSADTEYIAYTTDGTAPTIDSELYSEPIAITKNMTIKAIAIDEDMTTTSEVATAVYTIAPVATPTINPNGGEVAAGTEVTIAATDAEMIVYTTDGADPVYGDDLVGEMYENPIVVNADMTIKAIAIDKYENASAVASATFTVEVVDPSVKTATFDAAVQNNGNNSLVTNWSATDVSGNVTFTIGYGRARVSDPAAYVINGNYTMSFEAKNAKITKIEFIDVSASQYKDLGFPNFFENWNKSHSSNVGGGNCLQSNPNVWEGEAEKVTFMMYSMTFGKVKITYKLNEEDNRPIHVVSFNNTDDDETQYSQWSYTRGSVTMSSTSGNAYLADWGFFNVNSDGVLTFTAADDATITGIEFTKSTNNGDKNENFSDDVATVSVGSLNGNVWTGESNTVSFTMVSDNSVWSSFSNVKVTYKGGKAYVAKPTFPTPAGYVTEGTAVEISAPDAEMIVYTTDGTTPSFVNDNGEIYTTPIVINETTTIKAIAVDAEENESAVAEITYQVPEKVYTLEQLKNQNGQCVLVFEDKADYKVQVLGQSEWCLYLWDGEYGYAVKTSKPYQYKDVLSTGQVITSGSMMLSYGLLNNDAVLTGGAVEELVPIEIENLSGWDYFKDPYSFVKVHGTVSKETYEGGASYYIVDDVNSEYRGLNNSMQIEGVNFDDHVGETGYLLVMRDNMYGSAVVSANYFLPDNIILTVGATGYATLYYANVSLTVPEGVEAYTYTVKDGKLDESWMYGAGEVIPAATGVVIKANAGEYTFVPTAAEGDVDEDNLLKGSDEDTMTEGEDCKFYMLSLNADKDPNSVGFYFGKDCPNGEAFLNKAHKAYLAVPSWMSAGAMAFLFDGSTIVDGIDNVRFNVGENDAIYTIGGAKIENVKNLQKGIYVVNGHKVVVK